MRYLRLYEGFKKHEDDVQPIIDNINDILIDLTDDNDWDILGNQFSDRGNGFKLDVKKVGPLKNTNDKLGIYISISKSDGFIRSQSEEAVERINDYLKQEGYVNRGYNFDGYTLSITYRWTEVKVNETVLTSGDVTGDRKGWSEVIFNKIVEIGLYSDTKFTSKTWREPPTRPYDMSYEMGKSRISLSLSTSSRTPILLDDLDSIIKDINDLSNYLKSVDVGIMTLSFSIMMNTTTSMSNMYDYDLFKMSSIYDILDNNNIDPSSIGGVNRIYLVFKKFTNGTDISEYTEDYVDRYNDLFLPPF